MFWSYKESNILALYKINFKGYSVVLVADAISSGRAYDRKVAIERMQEAGNIHILKSKLP